MPAQNVLMEQTNANFPYEFIIQRVTFHIGSISPSLIHKVSCHFQAFIISVWLINAACLHMAAEYVLSVVICLLFQFEWMVSQAFLRADFTLPSLICHTEATTVEKTLSEIWAAIAQGMGFLILNKEMWKGLMANYHLNNGKWRGKKHLLLPRLRVSRDCVMSGLHNAVLWINTSLACKLDGIQCQLFPINDPTFWTDWLNAIEIHLETD